jgi:hypothetical protein
MVAAHEKTYRIRAVVEKSSRNLRTGPAPISKVVTKQHAIGHRIRADVGLIRTAVSEAVMRIGLTPILAVRIPRINIVAEGLLLAASQVRFLDLDSRVVPILLECHSASDSHDINEVLFAASFFRTGSDDPIADLGDASDSRLTRRKRADSEEGVGRKPVVSGHDVRVQSHYPQPYRGGLQASAERRACMTFFGHQKLPSNCAHRFTGP